MLAVGWRLSRVIGCRTITVLSVLLLVALILPGTARAWWADGWVNRAKVILDASPSGAAITEPIGRAPVLLRLHAGNFDFASAAEDGSDLRFVASDDKTPLKFHIEKFDGLIDQVGLVWVEVPDLAPGAASSIWMYWGNPKASAAADPAGTYDTDQLLVYHFGEADGIARDQTRNGNDALDPGQRDEAGLIGFGLTFANGGSIRLPASPSLLIGAGQPLTWSAWVRSPAPAEGILYSAGGEAGSFVVGFSGGFPYAEAAGPAGRFRATGGVALTAGSWHHLAVTVADRLVLWLDGVPVGEAAGSLPEIGGEARLGGPPPSEAATPAPAAPQVEDGVPVPPVVAGFAGQIDELQIARVARPAGFIQAAARSQGLEAKLAALDVAETSGAMGTGYMQVLFKSLTIDGWVVIVLCTIMAIVCGFVIVGKALTVGRVGRANKLFGQEFEKAMQTRGLHAGAAALVLSDEQMPRLRSSTTYAIYRTALKEIKQRVSGDDGGEERLYGENITAIRAALDSELMRQSQRLNAGMVLLTIAISGGPFLGLLGTVIGVMITFAAVAAAGDVNINAIAPGIAAALLATVAGLGVAIPALFGYNWLLTRIKEQTQQAQLFVNELTARIAEAYSGAAARHGG